MESNDPNSIELTRVINGKIIDYVENGVEKRMTFSSVEECKKYYAALKGCNEQAIESFFR